MKAIYPGSFDPLTLGHLDIIKRASKIFDQVLVLISENPDKNSHIDLEDRIKLIEQATKNFKNVKVASHLGLTVDYARQHKYHVLVRGIRAASDFETELEMSQINHSLSSGLETVFLMTSPEYSFIRASRVWELVDFGGDLSLLVPGNVKKYLQKNF